MFALVGYDITDQLRVTAEARYIRDEIDRVHQHHRGPGWPGATRPGPGLPQPAGGPVPAAGHRQPDFRHHQSPLCRGLQAHGRRPCVCVGRQGHEAGGLRHRPVRRPAAAHGSTRSSCGATNWAARPSGSTAGCRPTARCSSTTIRTDRWASPSQDAQSALPLGRRRQCRRAETKGLELDLLWHPIDELTLRLAYAYTDAEWTDFNYT